MKRTYIIAAVLLLLAFAAADTIYNHYRTSEPNTVNNDIPSLTPAPLIEAPVMAPEPNPMPANEVSNAENETVHPVAVAPNRHARHRGYRRHYNSTAINAEADLTPDRPIAVNNSNGPEVAAGVTVLKTKEYTGNMPIAKQHLSPVHYTRNRAGFLRGLGIELGFNENSFYNGNSSNIPTGNFNAGLLYNVSMGNHFAFQPGVRYITKGNKLESELDDQTTEKIMNHYIEVPANIVWKIGKPGTARFMVGAGPYASYLTSSTDKFNTTNVESPDAPLSIPQYSTNNINRFDWGVGGFIGVQVPEGLFLKAGGEAGMTDVMKNTPERNYNLMVSLGYIIGGE